MDDIPMGTHGWEATMWSLRIWPKMELQGSASSTFVLTKIRSSEPNTHIRDMLNCISCFNLGGKAKLKVGRKMSDFFH